MWWTPGEARFSSRVGSSGRTRGPCRGRSLRPRLRSGDGGWVRTFPRAQRARSLRSPLPLIEACECKLSHLVEGFERVCVSGSRGRGKPRPPLPEGERRASSVRKSRPVLPCPLPSGSDGQPLACHPPAPTSRALLGGGRGAPLPKGRSDIQAEMCNKQHQQPTSVSPSTSVEACECK